MPRGEAEFVEIAYSKDIRREASERFAMMFALHYLRKHLGRPDLSYAFMEGHWRQ